VTVHQLHPSIVSAVASFSPNGDGRVDVESVVVRLPDTETVDWKVLGPGGVLVRGPVRLGTNLAKGDHTLLWNGRSNGNVVQPNGWYTVVVNTSAGSLVGATSRSVRLDTVAPYMSSVVGYNGSVYPVHDGFRDTLTLGVTVNEAATVDVRIKNTAGAVVRLLTMKRSSPGPLRVVWSGYGSNGKMVPSGTYYAYYSSRDAALNYKTIGGYKLTVSTKKAVQKTAVLYPTEYMGVEYAEDAGGFPIDCAQYVPISYGVRLYNNCDEGAGEFGFSGAFFHFTVPASPMYTSLRFDVFGHSASVVRPLMGMTYNAKLDDYDAERVVQTSTTDAWRTVSTPTPADHILNRVVEPGVLLPMHESGVSNFEVGDARLVVGYKVLV
jgi:flagellar hook assembly protein FlgD